MMDRIEALAALLRETAVAHHRAFAATDGDDPDWPQWYADYLQPRLAGVVGHEVTAENLAAWLVRVDGDYRAADQGGDWPHYYANDLLAAIGKRAL